MNKGKKYRDNFRKVVLNYLDRDKKYFYPLAENVLVSPSGEITNYTTGRVYKFHKNASGYLRVNIKLTSGKRKAVFVHRVMAITFLSYVGKKRYEVNHIDGNKQNNDISNLEWMTRKENMKHAKKNNLLVPKYGENNPKCKFKDYEIEEMKEFRKLGYTTSEIKRAYNISTTHLRRILKGKNNERNTINL